MIEITLSYSYWNELGIFYLLKAEDSFNHLINYLDFENEPPVLSSI